MDWGGAAIGKRKKSKSKTKQKMGERKVMKDPKRKGLRTKTLQGNSLR